MSDSVRPHRRQSTRLGRPWDSPGKNIGVGCHFLLQCLEVKSESEVTQSCPTLSDPMDCSLPGSSIHGIFQARVLEWGAIAFSNMLSRLVTTFLPRSKRLLISWLQSPSAVILEPRKIKSDTVSTVSPSICHEIIGPDVSLLNNVVLVSVLQQRGSAKRIHTSPLFVISFPFRSPQSTELSSLCYTAVSHELSILFIVGGTSGKEPACQCRRHKRYRFDSWVGKIPWRRAWQPNPIFLENPRDRGAWWATVHRVTKS